MVKSSTCRLSLLKQNQDSSTSLYTNVNYRVTTLWYLINNIKQASVVRVPVTLTLDQYSCFL